MKTLAIGLVGLASTALGLAATPAPQPDQPEHQIRRQYRIGPSAERSGQDLAPGRPNPSHGPREKVAYLGIVVGPAGPSLVAQLGLAPHTGLAVVDLEPNSPASNNLKLHDVLVELDGQLLINPEQLAVLVRNHRAGDEITLKLIRTGKPELVKIKLTEVEAPIGLPGPKGPPDRPLHPGVTFPKGFPIPDSPAMMERRVEINRRGTDRADGMLRQSRIVLRDADGSIEVNAGEAGRTITAKNPDGEVVFRGPLNSPGDRQSLPESIRDRLEKLPELPGTSGPNRPE